MKIEIRELSTSTAHAIEPGAAESLFWPLGRTPTHQRVDDTNVRLDPHFDKEAWINNVLMTWGNCGFTAFVTNGDAGSTAIPAATVFYAPVPYMLGAELLPSGPVSADAVLLSTVHVSLPYMGLYLEHQLIGAVRIEAKRRGIKAIEAFARMEYPADIEGGIVEAYGGWRVRNPRQTGDERADLLHEAPMLAEEVLIEQGFHVEHDHPLYPRYRLEVDRPTSIFAQTSATETESSEHWPTVIGGGRKAFARLSDKIYGPRNLYPPLKDSREPRE